MSKIHSYSSIFNLGHKALEDLWDGRVYVQEKIDGSQFSFGLIDGELICRSKNQIIDQTAPGMFKDAVETARSLAALLSPGWTYRCEFLLKPKHNALKYDRVPNRNIILFDADAGDQYYAMPDVALSDIGNKLGLEVVPLLVIYDNWLCPGVKPALDELMKLLEKDSILGGVKIEGIVLKNYAKYGPDKKVLMAKLVSEDFREVAAKEWGTVNPSRGDFILRLIDEYRTEARWNKAVQHLRELGVLQNAPQDIPLITDEVKNDVTDEEWDEIVDKLARYFWKDISRGITKGIPEWYKAKLVEEAMK